MDVNKELIRNPDQYYIQLDGLRGIAIMMVILYHYFPSVNLFSFGWSGVDLFFVLSGFLITGRLYPHLYQPNILLKFYRNRILRIVPLYFGFLILFFILFFFIMPPQVSDIGSFYSQYWFCFFLFIQNWSYIFHLNHSSDYIRHFWSLAVEEQFYFIFPFFMLAIKKANRLIFISISMIILIALLRSLYFFSLFPIVNYEYINWNTFFRFDSFFIGAVLYFLIKFPKRNVQTIVIYKYLAIICFICLLVSFIYYQNATLSNPFFGTIGYTVVGILFSYIIFLSISNNLFFWNRIIFYKSLIKLGRISYGLYIFHLPIYLFGFGIFNKFFSRYSINLSPLYTHLINAGSSFFLTVIVSNLSYKYFESLFLKWKSKFSVNNS